MTDESQEFDPYAAVLADLKAKRAQIDQAINVIEGLRAGGVSGPMPAVGAASGSSTANAVSSSSFGPGAFLGMTIVDATKKLLRARKQALNNADIVAALRAGGMAMDSADPVNTIGSVLTRRFNKEGDIVRVSRGTWGLKEWYPNRSFGKKDTSKADASGTSEPEQPSEPNLDGL